MSIVQNMSEEDDDFPYKYKFYSKDDIKEMFRKLISYRVEPRLFAVQDIKLLSIKPNFSIFKFHLIEHLANVVKHDEGILAKLRKFEASGLKRLTISNKDSDYTDFNMLSDMYMEPIRMKCTASNSRSPYDHYMDHKVEYFQQLIKEGKDVSDYNLREKLYEDKRVKECTSHRPNLIMALAQIFNALTVLDPCSGWGDRLLGAMAAGIDYCGVDINKKLTSIYKRMIADFAPPGRQYHMIEGRTQDAIIPEHFAEVDLVFTSPPYGMFEIYSRDPDSSDMSADEKSWVSGFLVPMLDKYWKHVRVGGHMCINIHQTRYSQSYILDMVKHMEQNHLDSNYLGFIAYVKENDHKNPQPIWIWYKSPKPRVIGDNGRANTKDIAKNNTIIRNSLRNDDSRKKYSLRNKAYTKIRDTSIDIGDVHDKIRDEPLIKTERLYMRKFRMSDVPRMAEIYGNMNNMNYIATGKTFDLKETEKKIKQYIDLNYTLYPILRKSDNFIIGMCGYQDGKYMKKEWDGKKFLRILIDLPYRKFGYASEILAEYKKYHIVYSLVNITNEPSNKLMQKLGAKMQRIVSMHGIDYYLYKSE